ncbi:hypothetical protein HK096_011291, partial [Nowakowskiella sp. JEL0078]
MRVVRHTNILLFFLLALLIQANAKLTDEQRKLSREANKQITHLSQQDFTKLLAAEKARKDSAESRFIVFFGALWCSNTAIFNPKWLKVQHEVERLGFEKDYEFRMFKVECSHNE